MPYRPWRHGGKALIFLLLNANANGLPSVTREPRLEEAHAGGRHHCGRCGESGLVTADYGEPGTVVVDAGINDVDGKTVGGRDYDAVSE